MKKTLLLILSTLICISSCDKLSLPNDTNDNATTVEISGSVDLTGLLSRDELLSRDDLLSRDELLSLDELLSRDEFLSRDELLSLDEFFKIKNSIAAEDLAIFFAAFDIFGNLAYFTLIDENGNFTADILSDYYVFAIITFDVDLIPSSTTASLTDSIVVINTIGFGTPGSPIFAVDAASSFDLGAIDVSEPGTTIPENDPYSEGDWNTYEDGSIPPEVEIPGLGESDTEESQEQETPQDEEEEEAPIIEKEWTFMDIDGHSVNPNISAGKYPSIAVDSLGNVHIVYIDETSANMQLQYSTIDSSQNISLPQTIADIGNTTHYTSLAVDSNNNLHLSYVDYGTCTSASSMRLNYGYYSEGAWSLVNKLACMDPNMYSNYYYGYFSSIALDSNDIPIIAYHNKEDPVYSGNATWVEFTYCNDTIDNCASSKNYWALNKMIDTTSTYDPDMRGIDTSLAFFGNEIFVPFYTFDNTAGTMNLYVASGEETTAAGSFTETLIDTFNFGYATDGECTPTSIEIDLGGYKYLAYYGWENSDLKFACNFGDGWQTTVVDNTIAESGHYGSMVVDSSGIAHIIYWSYTTTSPITYYLQHATANTGSCPPEWTIETIYEAALTETGGERGEFTSTAIDSNDNLHIVFGLYDETESKYSLEYGIYSAQ